MTDNTELKRLAEAATPGPWYQHGGIMQVLSHDCETVCETFEDDGECPDAQFIAAANPAAVLALIAENERLQQREQDLSASVKYWFNACGGKQFEAGVKHADEAASKYIDEHWRRQRDQLRAENAGLRTGYEAYEQVNAELKAENEALRKELPGIRPFKPYQDSPVIGFTGCVICGVYTDHGGLPCPKTRATADAALGRGEQS